MNHKIHYKECSPYETVERLKSILKKMKIETEEILFNESKIGTNSIRVVFKGTELGTNGKGVNKEYCLASAYAELFERYENDYINPFPDLRNKQNYDFTKKPCEKYMTIEELIKQKEPFLDFYFKKRKILNDSDKEIAFTSINPADRSDGKYLTFPFYDVRSKKVVYLPYTLVSGHYGSNGMAAGNTPAEALVQGFSEIIERLVQTRIILEAPDLPDVPDEYIKKYPFVYDMYRKAQGIDGFNIYMKDCSLGGKYPVAGLMIIQRDTGKYGLKLGCHPDFGVAMERTLTEATQGTDIEHYTERSTIDFSNQTVKTRFNIMNSFATGLAQYPFQVLQRDYGQKFIPVRNIDGKSNEELLADWLHELLEDGHDILISDNSWLGFPAYHIIIPGLSEANSMTDQEVKIYNTRTYITELLKSPEKITEKDCKYIIGVLGYFKGNVLLDSTEQLLPFATQKMPYGTGAISTRYLAALCDVYCENYEDALEKLKPVLSGTGLSQLSEEANRQFKAECLYLEAIVAIKEHKKVMEYLKELLSAEMWNKIEQIYCEPKKILIKQLSKITESDIEIINNRFSIVYSLMDKLKDEMVKNPISQESLGIYIRSLL